jgi:hypothetical protein
MGGFKIATSGETGAFGAFFGLDFDRLAAEARSAA